MIRRAVGAALLALAPAPAWAEARFELEVVDGAGSGFNDPTPVAPVGGNTGTTLGQQRRLAFEHALAIWGRVLSSDVTIRVQASFAPLACAGGFAVLGQAGPAGVVLDLPELEPNVLYPYALADQIVGEDLAPGEPDIVAEFNGGLASCFDGFDWYYGFDMQPAAGNADLVSTVLHEVAHGLGFLTMIDTDTGEQALGGYDDPFTLRLLDSQSGQHWPDLSAGARAASARRARGVVWDGPFANAAAATTLRLGAPSIAAAPALAGLRGIAVDANFGRSLVTGPVTASVAAGTPADGCSEVSGVQGNIAVLWSGNCNLLDKAYFAQSAGAVAVLLSHPGSPPPTIDQRSDYVVQFPIDIPVLGISDPDADVLLTAAGATLTLSADGQRRTGSDAAGRLYMYASSDAGAGSLVSHFDPLVRPDLTMEPVETPNTHHDVKVDRALLRDLGWATPCGNGQLDSGEECDAGASNSDTAPNACRMDCLNPRCGDGVVDASESCDIGLATSSPECSRLCQPHVCGDGVVGPAELCDQGAANSDTTPNACRTSCVPPACGDGVLDQDEACDEGPPSQTCVACRPAGGNAAGGAPGSGGGSGAGATGGGAGSSGAGAAAGGGVTGGSGEGCSCRVPAHRSSVSTALPLLLGLGLLLRRRQSSSSARRRLR